MYRFEVFAIREKGLRSCPLFVSSTRVGVAKAFEGHKRNVGKPEKNVQSLYSYMGEKGVITTLKQLP